MNKTASNEQFFFLKKHYKHLHIVNLAFFNGIYYKISRKAVQMANNLLMNDDIKQEKLFWLVMIKTLSQKHWSVVTTMRRRTSADATFFRTLAVDTCNESKQSSNIYRSVDLPRYLVQKLVILYIREKFIPSIRFSFWFLAHCYSRARAFCWQP